MKKLSVAFVLFLLVSSGLSAQNGATTQFYKDPGSLLLNGGFYAISPPRTVTSPKIIAPEFTVISNLTAGISFTHYKFKSFSTGEADNTFWQEDTTLFNHYNIGLHASYHFIDKLNNLVKIYINPRKWDIYLTGEVGYNLIAVTSENPDAIVDKDNQKLRGGMYLGTRFYYNDSLGFFVKLGISHYGYSTFGLCYTVL
ncbi:MAG: hypothetical protein IIA45_06000 [Bacteroidetes bacterium]|nr:hypothetical protein [Bacteroidota bacterium]